MADITLTCDTCGKEFQKEKKEYNRRKRLSKTEFFCSISCAAKRPANLEHIEKHRHKSNYDISQHSKNRYDEYSDFRYCMKLLKNTGTNRKPIIDVDLPYLKELWDSQDGVCPFTGIKMELITNSNMRTGTKRHPYTASIDRIDNSKSYEKGNIRWISYMANIARNTFSDDDLIEFCKTVAQQHS